MFPTRPDPGRDNPGMGGHTLLEARTAAKEEVIVREDASSVKIENNSGQDG